MDRKDRNDEPDRGDEAQGGDVRPVKIDAVRMAEALRGPFVAMPAGLTREQQRQFILDHAK